MRGTMIVYTFSNDILYNVQVMHTMKSEEEAIEMKNYYETQKEQGVIEKIVIEGTMLAITYDIDYFGEYKNCTKEEIKNMILEQSDILSE